MHNQSEDIGTIMEMFALGFTEAQRLYQTSNFNLSIAIQSCLKRQNILPSDLSQRPVSNYPPKIESLTKASTAKASSIFRQGIKDNKERVYPSGLDKIQMQKMQRERQKAKFKNDYIVKKIDARSKRNLFLKKMGKPSQINQKTTFHSQFQQYLGRTFSLSFKEQLNDAFQQLWDTRRFMAVHVLNLSELIGQNRNTTSSPQSIQRDIMKNFLKEIYLSPKYAALFTKEFINYGLDPKKFDTIIYPHMRQLINLERDRFCLIILRYNQKASKVTVAAKLKIFEFINPRDFEGTKRRIIDKKKDINRLIDSEICPSVNHNPLDTFQKRKLDEDRKIRVQQEVQYQKMKEISHVVHKKQRQDRVQRGEESDEQIERLKQATIVSIIEEKVKEREQARKTFRFYKSQEIVDPIILKLRFPSGVQQLLSLPKSETLNYVFRYVQYMEQDLGFQNKENRLFDITQPLQNPFTEKEKNQTLNKLFECSSAQVLIIKEI